MPNLNSQMISLLPLPAISHQLYLFKIFVYHLMCSFGREKSIRFDSWKVPFRVPTFFSLLRTFCSLFSFSAIDTGEPLFDTGHVLSLAVEGREVPRRRPGRPRKPKPPPPPMEPLMEEEPHQQKVLHFLLIQTCRHGRLEEFRIDFSFRFASIFRRQRWTWRCRWRQLAIWWYLFLEHYF